MSREIQGRNARGFGRVAAFVAAVAGFGVAAPASAQTLAPAPPRSGWYVGGEAGWTHLADEPARATIPVVGPRSDNETWDAGFDVGGRVGYEWGGWRLEEEFRVQRNGAATFSAATATGAAVAYAAMTNLMYDFIGVGPVTMHVGGGVGAVTVHEEIKDARVFERRRHRHRYGIRLPGDRRDRVPDHARGGARSRLSLPRRRRAAAAHPARVSSMAANPPATCPWAPATTPTASSRA